MCLTHITFIFMSYHFRSRSYFGAWERAQGMKSQSCCSGNSARYCLGDRPAATSGTLLRAGPQHIKEISKEYEIDMEIIGFGNFHLSDI